MKKIIFIVSVFIGLFLFPATAFADSPLTSTSFSTAYEDNDIVKHASESGIIDSTIAAYLSDSNNPIDVKAAVINALSWSMGGKTNATIYCKLIYKKSLDKLKIENLSGDQQFCIGYMLALDDYFDTEEALGILKLAEKKIPNSFTVSIVSALVESMDLMDGEWEDHIEPLLINKGLNRDMKQDAVNIILDYMAIYSNSRQIKVSNNNVLVENGKSQTIYLYGMLSYGDTPVQVVKNSDKAYLTISKDAYGIFYIKINGLMNGASSIQIKNASNKIVTINFNVVSENTYNKLPGTVSMYIGSTNAYIGRTKTPITRSLAPFIKDDAQFIPIEFVAKAVGGSVSMDNKNGTSIITYGNKNVNLKAGSNTVSVNGKASKLKSSIETKNGKQFINVRDFAALTGKKYVYDNGLIIIADKNVNIGISTNDFILNEIAWLVTGGNLSMFYPTSFMEYGKYGYEDYNTGKVVIQATYNLAYDFSEGAAAVVITDASGIEKYGFIDTTGKYIVEPVYDWAGAFHGGLAPVVKDGKAGFIDKKGDVKIPFDYSKAGNFCGGLAPVLSPDGTKWGYIDVSGKLVIPYTYTDCTEYEEGFASVQIDGKWGSIDRNGTIVIQPTYDDAYYFAYGLAMVDKDSKEYLINTFGDGVIFYDNGDIYVGGIKDGYMNGIGVYTWGEGSQYTGEFTKGKFTGKAIVSIPDGQSLEGYWEDLDYVGETEPQE